jgi:L-fuconolactonase
MPAFPIVDSHVHLYDPEALDYPWMREFPELLRRHRMAEFDKARGAVTVEKLVFVEVDVAPGLRQHEAEWVAREAAQDPRIAGMVAAAPLELGAAVRDELDRLAGHRILRGIRRLIQSEPDLEFCLQPGFVEGVRLLPSYGLSFDICIRHYQLASATALARLCPDVQFVLDHMAKPGIREELWEPWAAQLRDMATLPNVACKISGVVTEAAPGVWTREDLRPYIEHAIACFGIGRVMFGGDWPVLDLAGRFVDWVEIVDWVVAGCSDAEKTALFRDNATRIYRL